jgi:fumarate hydratase subunit beta
MKVKRIVAPLKEKDIAALEAGDQVLLSGVIYTARDQAHLRMINLMEEKKALPVDLTSQVIYYCGPTPPGPRVIGACGPTTSSRMDAFTPAVLEAGLKGIIGKGRRSDAVRESIKDNKAVYFLAPGGAGAYLSERVKACEVVAFEDLGAEAIHKLEVENFPLIVGIDSRGKDIYKQERE